MKVKSIWLAIAGWVFVGFLAQSALGLDEVSYKALIEKDKIKFGEKVQFLITINYGSGTMPPAVNAPSFMQFDVLAENETTQEVGEGTERYKVYKKIWLLEPTETGRLSIASAIVTFQDPTSGLLKNGKTDVVFIMVEPNPDMKSSGKTMADAEENSRTASANRTTLLFVLGGGGVGVVLVILLLLLGKRKPAEPQVLPEDVAMHSLQQAIQHAETENLEKYYAALSRTLLDYIQHKFNLDAHVLGTQSLLEKLGTAGVAANSIQALKEFFQVADKAKFAGYVPDEDKMIELHATVTNFVETGRKLKIKAVKEKKKKTEDEEEN